MADRGKLSHVVFDVMCRSWRNLLPMNAHTNSWPWWKSHYCEATKQNMDHGWTVSVYSLMMSEIDENIQSWKCWLFITIKHGSLRINTTWAETHYTKLNWQYKSNTKAVKQWAYCPWKWPLSCSPMWKSGEKYDMINTENLGKKKQFSEPQENKQQLTLPDQPL